MADAPRADRSARKPKGQGGERREEILEQAMRLFARDGVHETSTRRIAEAVGVSQPTLYAYFPTKDALLEEVSARAFDELTVRMQAIIETTAPAERMFALGRAYIRFGLERPDAYRIAFMLEDPGRRAHDPDKPKAGAQCFDIVRLAVADRLGADHPDIEVTAQSLWASQHGLVSLLLARTGFPWVDRATLIDHHLRMLVASFDRGF